ncbi:MAG TPA: hypothetical protein VFN87_01450 [Solirubrobacteraceae bacterium]|nr:hypothetical protein [Solirubrobacteraceae bacterium]
MRHVREGKYPNQRECDARAAEPELDANASNSENDAECGSGKEADEGSQPKLLSVWKDQSAQRSKHREAQQDRYGSRECHRQVEAHGISRTARQASHYHCCNNRWDDSWREIAEQHHAPSRTHYGGRRKFRDHRRSRS